jgi:hypothetical protein
VMLISTKIVMHDFNRVQSQTTAIFMLGGLGTGK